MLKRLNNFKYYPWLVFLFSLTLYMSNIWGSSIYILDEAKNSTCASEMFSRNDLIVPTFNQELRTDKPPLHYFFMMLSYAIFGVNAFAARFFSAVFGAFTILISYLFIRKYSSEKAALWSVFVLLSSIHLSIQFHLAVPDPYLIFFFTASIYSFYAAIKERRFIYLLSMYLSIGLGTLAKGPIAIGLPGLIFLLFLIFSKRFSWKEIRRLHPFLGIVIVLTIALPWYILVHIKTNGLWTEGFFLQHNLGRFSNAMEGHGGLFLNTFLFVLAGLFPFSVFIFQALKKAFSNRKEDFILLNLVAGLTIVAFFAFSRTKLPNYTVPAYPYFAILIGLWISQLDIKTAKLNTSMLVLVSLSLILIPVLIIGLKFDQALAHENYLPWYFIPLPLGLVAAYVLFQKRKIKTSFLIIGASAIVTSLIFASLVFPKIDQQNPVAKSLQLLKGKEIRYYEKFNPSYSFYLQQKIEPIEVQEISTFFKQYPKGVVISTKDNIDKVNLPTNLEVSFSSHDIFESPTTVLLTKKP